MDTNKTIKKLKTFTILNIILYAIMLISLVILEENVFTLLFPDAKFKGLSFFLTMLLVLLVSAVYFTFYFLIQMNIANILKKQCDPIKYKEVYFALSPKNNPVGKKLVEITAEFMRGNFDLAKTLCFDVIKNESNINLKQNAYIDKVEIDRNLPDELKITVTERESTYMFTFGNAYVYINNQGYLLEITSEKGNFPMITGYQTPEEQIIEGNRLCTEDLQRLEDVLRIMEAARSVDGGVDKLITQIDISDKSNYILTLEKEKKQVYLGDASNLGTKMLWINKLLEEEKDNEGIIFINVDLINSEPYFRRKV